jgi:hypothetical protein
MTRSGLSLFSVTGSRRTTETPLTTANINANNNLNNAKATGNDVSNPSNTMSGTFTQQELGYIKWQNEMERGFEVLVQAIYPYIAELHEAAVFSTARYSI